MDQDGLKLYGPIRLAKARTACWQCDRDTTVVALIAADLEEVVEGTSHGRLGEAAYVYGLAQRGIPAELATRLSHLALQFRPIHSRPRGTTEWANACEHCAALQGDSYLHSEPDGPFFGGPMHFSGEILDLWAENLTVADALYAY